MTALDTELVKGFVETCLAKGFDGTTATPEFHEELWDLCTSTAPLVAIGAPRGHAKSTAVTHSYTLAAVLFQAARFVLIISDTEAQAVEFLRDIKKELEANERIISLFGVKGFLKTNETDVIVEMDDGYTFRIVAKGSEQKVRGLKWDSKRPDLIVIDDCENDEIVMNQERRDKFKRWFRGALLPCRSPQGKVRMVGTVLHMGSMLNDVLPKPWLRSTKVEELKMTDTNPKAMWKSVKYRAHNEDWSKILWETRFNKEKLQEIRQEYIDAGYPDVYSQEYLNEPIDESVAFFKKADFVGQTEKERQEIANKIKPLKYYAGADLAISEKERADWSVIHVVGMDANGVLWHQDTVRRRMDGREIVEEIIRTQLKYNLEWFAIEQEKIAKAIGPFLKEEMIKRGSFTHLIEITPSADKRTRARSIQGRMRIGSVRFDKQADYYTLLENEFIRFPRDIHDDQVDAYSVIGLALDKMLAANTVEEQREEERDEFEREYGFAGISAGRDSYTGY